MLQKHCRCHIAGVGIIIDYHGINLACVVKFDAESSAAHVAVQYAVRQADACFTFQSIGDDSEHCRYVVNYVVLPKDYFRVFHHLSRITINYFTYLKSSGWNHTSECKDKEHGVQVIIREPHFKRYALTEEDQEIKEVVR